MATLKDDAIIRKVATRYNLGGNILSIKPFGDGLINDTFRVVVAAENPVHYVFQRVNIAVFPNVELLHSNMKKILKHIRARLEAENVTDINRKVLTLIPTADDSSYVMEEGQCWRVTFEISNTFAVSQITTTTSYRAGLAFGRFQSMLADMSEPIGPVIPRFHDVEYRLEQLRDAISNDKAGRLSSVADFVSEIEAQIPIMVLSPEQKSLLPTRLNHCDPKLDNILFDGATQGDDVLCVIDLDTVMPANVLSDFGDFLRSAANSGAEDDPDLSRVSLRLDVVENYAKGFLEAAGSILTEGEISLLPYATLLFPYMAAVRFMTDYLNGDVYFKTKYELHNLVRAKSQWHLFRSAESKQAVVTDLIASIVTGVRSSGKLA